MHEIAQWIAANPGKVTAAALLILKWIYNAWPSTGTTWGQFFRTFIGEVVQEAPQTKIITVEKKAE